ncbi:MAG TPA: DUF4383 domain-containing protein [Actinomycetota bacterium]
MTVTHGRSGWRHGHRDHTATATEASSLREPYGASQIFAVAFGVFFIVLGAVGLARGGVDSMTSPRVQLMGLSMTPMLALIHLAMGILAVASGVSRSTSRGMSTFLGAALIALGAIALIEPIEELGWATANGVAYLIIGALAIAVAAMTPAMEIRERRVVMDDSTTDQVA